MDVLDKAKQITDICQQLEVVVRCGQKMKNHTALGVGGEIDAIAYPETPEAAATLVNELEKASISWSALGRGSHILVKDQSISRIVISLKLLEEVLLFKDIENKKDKLVYAHCGYQMSKLAVAVVERKCSRLEGFISYLGTLGAVIHHKDNKDLFLSCVESFTCVSEGKIVKMPGYELYHFTKEEEEKYLRLVLGAELKVFGGGSENYQKKLLEKVNRTLKKRRDNLLGTGPVFEEKVGRRTAEKLIKDANLVGFSCGDAMIGTHKANFIVNKGNANSNEVLELIDQVKDKVKQHSGAELRLALEIWE